jgi:hypothetical protein
MGDHLHALTALLPGMWTISHSTYGWVGPPGLVKTGRRKRKFLVPHCSSNPTVQLVASRYTIYTIPLPAIKRVTV